MSSRYILIADSGSTKTDWVTIDDQSGNQQVLQSAGINPFYQTAEEIIPVLQNQVLPEIAGDIHEIHFYGAGCADEKSSMPVTNALKHCFQSATAVEVASDMLGAARGLCGHEPGLACILGTGANNAFFDGQRITHSIGSLGFWLGDEGGGSYLGKTLVVHYLQNELPQDLHEIFIKEYPGLDRLTVLDHAYKKPYPNRYFASFSEFIAEHRSHGFMQELLKNAFGLFVKKYILKHHNAEKYPVHFTGSIAYYYQDVLLGVLESEGLQSGRILKSPLEGLVVYHLADLKA
ncbi:N-acetylglucosamine kinase [Dyadobacter sp. CY261]|uniref:N-acetylglucosamine kinase n=1 Tax=Dyadobacter sp. CY261 TaxID=2907203 RepID=UPI001F42ACE2|nr:N-acetylglucosamine kinase [Dyadobacter sp. CY261]MCF0071610.1 N-acetylglucosamine kinase [Dyadobacter sp. CY261]